LASQGRYRPERGGDIGPSILSRSSGNLAFADEFPRPLYHFVQKGAKPVSRQYSGRWHRAQVQLQPAMIPELTFATRHSGILKADREDPQLAEADAPPR